MPDPHQPAGGDPVDGEQKDGKQKDGEQVNVAPTPERVRGVQAKPDQMPTPAPPGTDQGSFDQFYQRELPAMVALAAAVTGTHLGAEDIAQEGLVRAYRDWDRVSMLDKPGAWLRRVTLNLALSGRRRAGSELRARLRLVPPPAIGVLPPSPAEHAEVWAAVGRLPPNQRAAVALHYLEDQPVSVIADVLGCAEATARVHLHRGRTALAAMLEGVQQ